MLILPYFPTKKALYFYSAFANVSSTVFTNSILFSYDGYLPVANSYAQIIAPVAGGTVNTYELQFLFVYLLRKNNLRLWVKNIILIISLLYSFVLIFINAYAMGTLDFLNNIIDGKFCNLLSKVYQNK